MQVILKDIDENNLVAFKEINRAVLPSSYTDDWYNQSLEVGQLAKAAYHESQMIGAIRCALIFESGMTGIYIMTLAVLALFRKSGVGSSLLNHIKAHARQLDVDIIYLHAWEKNQESINWYKHHGFIVHSRIEGYYTRMKPVGDAVLMVFPLPKAK